MLGFAGSSYAAFAAVWGLMCLLSGAVVADAMLRSVPSPATIDAAPPGAVSAVET